MAGIFIGDSLYNFPRAPTTAMLLQSFSNLMRSWIDTLSTKACSAFLQSVSVLLLLPFYEAFSIPGKNEKCGEGHKSKFHGQ